MLYVSTSPMFASYFGAFENGGKPFSSLLYKAENTEFAVMPSVCLIQTAEFGVFDLFQTSGFCGLHDEGRLCANKVVLIPPSREMKAKITEGDLLKIIGYCGIGPVSVLLVLARANEIDCEDLEASSCYPYDFASTMIIAVLQRKANSCEQGRHDNALSGTVHPKNVPKIVKEF